ncbi:MAG: hypothetical protein INQ03_23700 [Candidatus Heimdallarchaeota archaeon]|nr:hypothetical protein [Candidatus Heimdallarchaeota archaeon]
MVLDEVKKYLLEHVLDDDTGAILIIGSWAKGDHSDPMDIDVMIVKKYQLTEMYNHEYNANSFQIDAYVYDQDTLLSELQGSPNNIDEINNVSMALLGLKNSLIIYQKEDLADKLIAMANSWSWKQELIDYLNPKIDMPDSGWRKKAVEEDLILFEEARKRLLQGQPITSRKKDYVVLLQDYSEQYALDLMDLVDVAYKELAIEIMWTEFKDAKTSLSAGNWSKTVASLKDVLRYLLRYNLPTAPLHLLDPNLWISEMSISPALEQALEMAFTVE